VTEPNREGTEAMKVNADIEEAATRTAAVAGRRVVKLSQSPEAMELKRRLREGILGGVRKLNASATEHDHRAPALLAQEELDRRAREMTLVRMQRLMDQAQEAYLDRLREREAADARSCHRGSGDPDWSGPGSPR
jgi:hypothetical protein